MNTEKQNGIETEKLNKRETIKLFNKINLENG